MPLKIVFLSHFFYPSIGGIETISELLATFFTTDGHEVHVITWSTDHTGKSFPFTIVRRPGLRKLLQEHAWADVIFENNPCLRLSWPILIYKHPSIVVLQTWLPGLLDKRTLSNRIKLLHLKKATKVIAISDAIRKRCWPNAGIIANSYNASIFKTISSIQKCKDFVFVGRLVSDKGADLAVKALHLLNTRLSEDDPIKKFSLTIIGEGPDRASLDKLVAKFSLENMVEFKGSLTGKNLAYSLNQHRYILVPSVWEEPFGIVALEGMACGCLPIVSDRGGLPDAVGDAGILFSSGDVESLVMSILELLTNPDLEQQLRLAAKSHLEAHHPDEISQDYLDIIKLSAIN